MREPCIVRWPSRIAPAQVRADVAGTLDLFPTFLDLAGIEPSAGPALDGRSLVPLLDGGKLEPDRPLYYFKGGFLEAVREGRWKFRETAAEGSGRTRATTIDGFIERTLEERRSFTAAEVFGDAAIAELYDLDVDPSEQWNVAAEHPEIVDRLRRQMAQLASTMVPGAAFDLGRVDPETAERRRIGRPGAAGRTGGDGGKDRPRGADDGSR